jgi:hypothetical protein
MGPITKKVFLLLAFSMGIPSLFQSFWLALYGFDVGQEIILQLEKSMSVGTNPLGRMLSFLESMVHTNFFGALLDFVLTLIAYFASLRLWVANLRGQNAQSNVGAWLHAAKTSVFKGSILFLCLALLSVLPLQPMSIIVGALLLMGPVIMVVEATGGTRAIGRALALKYARPPEQMRPQVFSTLMNLIVIFLAVYGMFGLTQVSERLILELDWLQPPIHQVLYHPWNLFGVATPWTLGFLLAHLFGTFIRIMTAMFMGYSTVKLYFSIVQRRTIAMV